MSWARRLVEPAIVLLVLALIISLVFYALSGEEAKKSRAAEECGVYTVLSYSITHERFPWRRGELRVVCATEDPGKGRVVEVSY